MLACALVQPAGPVADDAQRPDAFAARHDQGRAGVMRDKGAAGDQRVVGKAGVKPGILDLEQTLAGAALRADGARPTRRALSC